MLRKDLDLAARTLWEFHNVSCDVPTAVDFVLALGSHDLRVAERAAQLIIDGHAPLLVTAGGLGKVTGDKWHGTEAERFAAVAVARGVDPGQIVVEPASTNTGENITLARALLLERHTPVASGLMVTKPYMRHRALATARRQWPEVEWHVASPDLSFEEYPNDDVPESTMIELMVGDLQRMEVYAENGLQVPVVIPPDVWDAYEILVDAGYNRFVIRN